MYRFLIFFLFISFLYSNTPEDSINSVINLYHKNDFKSILKYIYLENNNFKDVKILNNYINYEEILKDYKNKIDQNGGIKDIKILNIQNISKKEAKVTMSLKFKNKIHKLNFFMIQKDKIWKIKPF